MLIPIEFTLPSRFPVILPVTSPLKFVIPVKLPDTSKLPPIVVLPPTSKFAATKELLVTVQTPAT